MIKNKYILIMMIAILSTGACLLLMPMEAFNLTVRKMFVEYSWLDKVSHFLLFFSLTSSIFLSINIRKLPLLGMMSVFAILAELMQTFGVRTVSAFDMMANISGVLVVFIMIILPLNHYIEQKK
jgi:VanZ family protein